MTGQRPTQRDLVLELLFDGREHSTLELQHACGGLRVPSRRPEPTPRPIDDCMRCGKREPLVEDACGGLICDECAAPPAPWLVTCPTCRAPKRATAKAGLIYLACGHFTHRDELARPVVSCAHDGGGSYE